MGRIWVTEITYRSCIVLVTVIMAICSHVQCGKTPHNRTEFPALFIFGDSIVDVGNNDYIFSLAKANFYPYGVDFNPGRPFKPTGRFCNGKTVVDFIGDHYNLPLIPAYLDPNATGKLIFSGVNYASAAGGILSETGLDLIGRRGFAGQLNWFGKTIIELKELIGEVNATDLIKNALYAVVIGSNDYLNNYLILNAFIHFNSSATLFQQRLLHAFQDQLTILYKMGARNMIVAGLGPLGCLPSQLVLRSTDGNCSEDVNKLALNFNIGLQQMLHELNKKNSDAKFRYANVYDYLASYIKSPSLHGFQVANESCCGSGLYKAQSGCRSSTPFCPNRTVYVFWDRYHTTQAVNQKLAQALIREFNNSILGYDVNSPSYN